MPEADERPGRASGGDADGRPRVLLVCSSGGHLQQMLALRGAWEDCGRTWVCLRTAESRPLLSGEHVIWAHGPTNRSLKNLFRNLGLAWMTLRRIRPDAVLSTGAGVAVPFIVLARLTGARTVYVESLTRVTGLSLSARLIRPFAEDFFVQWPGAAGGRKGIRDEGQVL